MSRDSKMCAAQFAKGMGIGLGVGMAVGAAAARFLIDMADSLQCYERQAPVPAFPKAACIIPCGTPRRKAQAPYAPSGARRIKK